MTDQANGTTGPSNIDIANANQVQIWAEKFDATSAQILEAVKAVGPSAADVEMHLKGTHATTNADMETRAERANVTSGKTS